MKLTDEAVKKIKEAPTFTMDELEGLETASVKKENLLVRILRSISKPACIGGFIAGMMYMVIACGLTYGKTWERIDK